MRQRSVFLIDSTGVVIAVDSLSKAAEDSGITIADVVGKRFWHWHNEANGRVIRQHIAECLFTGGPVTFDLTSKVADVVEHWTVRMTLVPVTRNILCVAVQRFPGVVAALTRQQSQLIDWMSQDATYAEMAERLKITDSALHQRLATLRKKLGVQTNHGLMVAAGRHGLLT